MKKNENEMYPASGVPVILRLSLNVWLKVARLDFSIVSLSNFKHTSQRAKTQYRRLISTLLPGIDQSFGCGVFYQDRSYHSNAVMSLLCLLAIDFLAIWKFSF